MPIRRTFSLPISLLICYPRWIVGCATGEEVYGFAVLLEEEEILDRCTIYATDLNDDTLARVSGRIRASIEKVIEGKPEVAKLALVVLLSDGHLLIEDVPGVGKTMLSKALALSKSSKSCRPSKDLSFSQRNARRTHSTARPAQYIARA